MRYTLADKEAYLRVSLLFTRDVNLSHLLQQSTTNPDDRAGGGGIVLSKYEYLFPLKGS